MRFYLLVLTLIILTSLSGKADSWEQAQKDKKSLSDEHNGYLEKK